MMRSHRLSQLRTDSHSGAFRCWPAREEHDTSSGILERRLHEADCDAEGDASTAQVTAVVCGRPRVLLQCLQRFRELELSLLYWHEEPGCGSHGHRATRLLLHTRTGCRRRKTQHVLNLFGRIVFISSENVGFRAALVANLVHLSLAGISNGQDFINPADAYHCAVCDKAHQRVLGKEAQTHDKRFLEGSQTVIFLAKIDNIEEDGRGRGRSGQPIFDSCICRVQFGGNGVLRDVFVVRGERVSRQAKRADPNPSANVDLAVCIVSSE